MILANSPTIAPTFSVSPTPTQTTVLHYYFSVAIYNSAGEKVKSMAEQVGALYNPASDFKLSSPAFAAQTGQPLLISAGGSSFPWDADNNSAQPIQSGTYYVKIESHDLFGHVESSTLEVTVIQSTLQVSIKIFNSAGEEIKELPLPSGMSGSPSGLHASSKDLVLAQGAAGSGGVVTFTLDNGSSVTWDGTNNARQKVASGSYTAQLISTNLGAKSVVQTVGLTVLNAPDDLLGAAFVATNPVTSINGYVAELRIPGAASGMAVVGRLYNLAGELVLTATNDMNPGVLSFDLGIKNAAAGTYVLAVTAKAPWGTVQRKVFKLVLMR